MSREKYNSLTLPKSTVRHIDKGILTSGDIAYLTKVSPRTVINWFDRDLIKFYQIPGSLDRRVTVENFLKFVKEWRIQLPPILANVNRIIAVSFLVVPEQVETMPLVYLIKTLSQYKAIPNNLILGLEIDSQTKKDIYDLIKELPIVPPDITDVRSDDTPPGAIDFIHGHYDFVQCVHTSMFNWESYLKVVNNVGNKSKAS